MNRSDLLKKLAMGLAEWPENQVRMASLTAGSYRPWRWSFGASGWALQCQNEIIVRAHWRIERARLINKPSWDDAPDRAEWLAQDGGGMWYWYEDMPKRLNAIWWGPAVPGRSPIQGALPAGHDWRATLEQRPAERKEAGAHQFITAKIETTDCPHCHGLGVNPIDPDAVTSCLECDGDGVVVGEPTLFDPTPARCTECSHCDAILSPDEVHYLETECNSCAGAASHDEPESPEWDGKTWPPPVGSRCMMKSPILGMWAGEWLEVEVVSHRDTVAVGWCDAKGGIALWAGLHACRPIKSARQISIESLARAIQEHEDDGRSEAVAMAEAIYAAIQDGEVPGVKLGVGR